MASQLNYCLNMDNHVRPLHQTLFPQVETPAEGADVEMRDVSDQAAQSAPEAAPSLRLAELEFNADGPIDETFLEALPATLREEFRANQARATGISATPIAEGEAPQTGEAAAPDNEHGELYCSLPIPSGDGSALDTRSPFPQSCIVL